ncbi:MAG: hypothetical protein JNK04_15370 [Myxococcales bacterium]|nr:hypothetical protein [Myxococcales bacterium]
MAGRSLHRLHLALPFGLLGLFGASLTADHFGLSGSYRDGLARGPLTLFLPLVGSLLGLLLSARAIAKRRWATVLVVILGTELAAATIGGVVSELIWPLQDPWYGVASGLATGLAFLPVVSLLVWLARRVGRARAGSLVDETDRRAPWMIIAIGVAAFQGPVAYGARTIHHINPDVTAALGLLAFGAIVTMALLDFLALRRANASVLGIGSMRARDPDSAFPCEDVEDLGVGDDEHEALEGGVAYRGNPRPIRVVRGTPEVAVPMLRAAVTRSVYALMLGLLGCAIPYMVHGHRFGVFRFLL